MNNQRTEKREVRNILTDNAINVMSNKEASNWVDPSDSISWKIDDKYITAHKGKGKFEFYNISKDRCLTEKERIEWVTHMCEKVWVNKYDFGQLMIKAIKKWNL